MRSSGRVADGTVVRKGGGSMPNPPRCKWYLGIDRTPPFWHKGGCAYCALNKPIPYWPSSREAL
jgi:hypothetical protein